MTGIQSIASRSYGVGAATRAADVMERVGDGMPTTDEITAQTDLVADLESPEVSA